jgi:hypothetical protein
VRNEREIQYVESTRFGTNDEAIIETDQFDDKPIMNPIAVTDAIECPRVRRIDASWTEGLKSGTIENCRDSKQRYCRGEILSRRFSVKVFDGKSDKSGIGS